MANPLAKTILENIGRQYSDEGPIGTTEIDDKYELLLKDVIHRRTREENMDSKYDKRKKEMKNMISLQEFGQR